MPNGLVGALLYVSVCTRLKRLRSSPLHSSACRNVQRTLQYLASTADLKLALGGTGELGGFVDADWADDMVDLNPTWGSYSSS